MKVETLINTMPAVAAVVPALMLLGCAAKAPPLQEDVLDMEAPAAYKSKLKTFGTAETWLKQLSADGTLVDLVEEVKKNNWDIKKAAVHVKTAAAEAKIAGSKRYPFFSTKLEGQRAQQAFIGFPLGGQGAGDGISKSLSNNFGLSLDVAWEIDLWGRIRTGQEAAIAEVQASAEDLRSVASSLGAQTAKVWFALMEANEQVRLSEKSLVSFGETLSTLRTAFEAGNGSAAQVRVATADLETAKALLEERNGQVRAAKRQLEVLLGRYPGAEIESARGLPDVPPPPPAGVPSGLLRRRSDLAAAERRLAAAERRIKEAKLALLPQISLTGSGGTASDMLRDVTDSGFGVWSIGGRVSQQLMRGGEILGNIELRKLAREEAFIDYQRTALTAFQEVETNLDNEVILRKREEALRSAQENLIAAYERGLQEYRDGLGSATGLLVTQRQTLSTASQVLTLHRLRLDNRIDLFLALGGDVELDTMP